MRQTFFYVLCLLLFLGVSQCSRFVNGRNAMDISREVAVKTATVEAKRLGFKAEEMIALNPDAMQEWNDYYKKVYSKENALPQTYATEWRKQMESTPTLADKLGGKDYWAVYFGPRTPMMGGDLWVFIDKNDGDVIAHLRGK